MTRIRSVKDDDMQLLIECFTGNNGEGEENLREKFSENFLELLIKVIREKKDRF